MRATLLLVLTALAAALPVHAQTKTYTTTDGKKVTLKVDENRILVQRVGKATSERVAIEAIQTQFRLLEVKYADADVKKLLKNQPAVTIEQFNAILVPRLPKLQTSQVGNLAFNADIAGQASLVFTYNKSPVILTGTVTVRFDGKPDLEAIKGAGLKMVDAPKYLSNLVRCAPIDASETDLFSASEKLKGRKNVLWAKPDLAHLLSRLGESKTKESDKATNDPFLEKQWYLKPIKAFDAWKEMKGQNGKSVIVAVIDDGVDLDHEDLKDRLVTGTDFVIRKGDGAPADSDSHGTACAGLIAAKADNKAGVAGLAANARIMPIRISSGNNFVADSTIAEALIFAKDNKAKILSCSWGGGPPTDEIINALKEVSDAGCLIVAASGNATPTLDCFFPASDKHCLAIGAVGRDSKLWKYSCFGPDYEVALVAPSGNTNLRGDIWTTDHSGKKGYNKGTVKEEDGDKDGNYTGRFGGTSAATPIVAGVAALIWAHYPNLTAAQVREALTSTAEKVDKDNANYNKNEGHRSKLYGYGRVDALAALRKAKELATKSEEQISTQQRFVRLQKTDKDVKPSASVEQVKMVLAAKDETYRAGGKPVSLDANEKWVATILPSGAKAGNTSLKNLVKKGEADSKLIQLVGTTEKGDVYLIPRDALRSEKELLALAKQKALPPLLSVYSGGGMVISLGTLTCRISTEQGVEKLKEYARKNHLLFYQVKDETYRLELTRDSKLGSVFEVSRQVWEEVEPVSCSPDFMRKTSR